MAEFIFEIGCEEIPARFICPAEASILKMFEKRIVEAGIACGEVRTFGTPRRLGLLATGLETVQADRVEVVTGPKVAICFDAEGKPTKVVQGFARGQGVAVEDLEQVEGPKGLCVQATKTVKGKATAELLKETMTYILSHIPFQKSMRWAAYDTTFARPIHWILSLFDGEVIEVAFAGVRSGNTSCGHRFMHPEPFSVGSIAELEEALKQRSVIATFAERREIVRREALRLADSIGGRIMDGEALLDEVANLVEYPVPLLGRFDEEFLEVPKEILIDSMAKHQKYFAVLDEAGELMPRFVVISNTVVTDAEVVAVGNARVLRARLSDARFFYDEDRKRSLEDLAAKLSKVTFEERLGSVAEKIDRMKEHIRYMVSFISPEVFEHTLRTVDLCKADLLSNVVGEFPSLQGVMGGHYARLQKEDALVARAIEQHYWPRFADDALPEDAIGAMTALADKMDTVVGCFGVGLKPTGAADPYALRRQALGILRILVEHGYRLPLRDWIEFSAQTLAEKIKRPQEDVVSDVLEFFEGRYRNWRVQDFKQDTLAAVVGAGFSILPEVEQRLAALEEIRTQEDFEPLAVAFKRVMNILKEPAAETVNPDLFDGEAEKKLWGQSQKTRDKLSLLIRSGDFMGGMRCLVELKEPVDTFFDDVMVMVEDKAVRNNRLALLWSLADLFGQLADFRKIQTAN